MAVLLKQNFRSFPLLDEMGYALLDHKVDLEASLREATPDKTASPKSIEVFQEFFALWNIEFRIVIA